MSRPPLFRTEHLFADPTEAVEFYNAHRAEPDAMDPIPVEVLEFLESVKDYDPAVVFNVQPAFKSHYVAAALPTDHHVWLYAKPHGVVFTVGDERIARAVLATWGEPDEVPQKLMPTDVWVAVDELDSVMAEFCLRIAAEYATWKPLNG